MNNGLRIVKCTNCGQKIYDVDIVIFDFHKEVALCYECEDAIAAYLEEA